MDILNRLTEDWNNTKDINVYGFGRVAQRNIDKLNQDFNIVQVIDNSPDLVGRYYNNTEIKSFVCCKDHLLKRKTIVTTSSVAYDSIKEQLNSIGLVEFKDFCRLEDFMPEWYWKNKRQVCISQIFSSVTSKCTFNCRYCCTLTPYYKENYEYCDNEILNDIDMLFNKVDYVSAYFIIGGEPLLNKGLPSILSSICERYRNKIGYIQIISNGTIIPSKDLMNVMSKYDINIRLSDYTHVIKYDQTLSKVKQTLNDNNLDFSVSFYDKWFDLGINKCMNYYSDDKVKEHMLNCSNGCHQVNDGKLFYCAQIFAADKCGLHKAKEEDYIDLTETSEDIELDKKKVLEYVLGQVPKNYISTCKVCRGMGPDNKYIVSVGEQI